MKHPHQPAGANQLTRTSGLALAYKPEQKCAFSYDTSLTNSYERKNWWRLNEEKHLHPIREQCHVDIDFRQHTMPKRISAVLKNEPYSKMNYGPKR